MARGNWVDEFFDDLYGMTCESIYGGYNREAEITRLQGENERLRVERDQYKHWFRVTMKKCARLEAKLERAGINAD